MKTDPLRQNQNQSLTGRKLDVETFVTFDGSSEILDWLWKHRFNSFLVP